MNDCWIDDFGMVQCPRCEQVFPVDAKYQALPAPRPGLTLLRIPCPNCENICRVECDALAMNAH